MTRLSAFRAWVWVDRRRRPAEPLKGKFGKNFIPSLKVETQMKLQQQEQEQDQDQDQEQLLV